MKREIERERKLTSYKIDIADLEVLLDRLLKLFPVPEEVRFSICINLKNERLEFDNIDELKDYDSLKSEITNFTLWLSKNDKRIILRAGGFLRGQGTIEVTADNEAWCAGVIETASSFLQGHRLWYHWLISSPLGLILYLFIFLPTMLGEFLPKDTYIPKLIIFAWGSIALTLAVLYIARAKLFPASIIVVRKEEGFFQRNASQLSLLMAIVTAVLTIIGWFVSSK